jgi:hypothetical protein
MVTHVARVAFGAGLSSNGVSEDVPFASIKPDMPGPGSAEAGSPGTPDFAPSEYLKPTCE